MFKNILWLIVVALAALMQSTWPNALRLQEVVPDVTLLIVVYFAIVEGEERAMLTGVIGGVYQDVAMNSVLGHHVLCLVVTGYTIGRLSTRLITEHPAIKAGLVFCASVGSGTLFTMILYIQQPSIGGLYTIATTVIPQAFYTAVITPIVFFLLGRLFQHRESWQGGYV